MCSANALCEQIRTVSMLAASMEDGDAKNGILTSHANSLKVQLGSVTLDTETAKQIVDEVAASVFSTPLKDGLKKAIADRLVQCVSPSSCAKRSTQALLDISPFLTEKDVEFFSNTDYNIEAKVNRLALVFARLGCTNPTEQSTGRAVAMLQQSFRLTALDDAQVFFSHVQNFKTYLKAHIKTLPSASHHLTTYSTPDALPEELRARAYVGQEQPANFKATPGASSVGPLRGSHTLIKKQKTMRTSQPMQIVQNGGSSGSDASMMNAMMASTATGNPMAHPIMNLMFSSMSNMFEAFANQQSQGGGLTLRTPSRKQNRLALMDGSPEAAAATQSPSSTALPDQETPPPAGAAGNGQTQSPEAASKPLSPKEQAEAMMLAWDARAADRIAEQEGKIENDDEAEQEGEVQKKPACKRPASSPKAAAKAKAKSKGAAKAEDKINVKSAGKGKGNGKGNGNGKSKGNGKNKGKGKALSPAQKEYWAKKPKAQRIAVRPEGCGKCRWTPGCCPSCFA